MVVVGFQLKNGKYELLIGLSRGNVNQLLEGKAVVADDKNHDKSLVPLGLSKVTIGFCETESDMLAELAMEFPNAPVRIHPRLFS